jgi:hypothetical protein
MLREPFVGEICKEAQNANEDDKPQSNPAITKIGHHSVSFEVLLRKESLAVWAVDGELHRRTVPRANRSSAQLRNRKNAMMQPAAMQLASHPSPSPFLASEKAADSLSFAQRSSV